MHPIRQLHPSLWGLSRPSPAARVQPVTIESSQSLNAGRFGKPQARASGRGTAVAGCWSRISPGQQDAAVIAGHGCDPANIQPADGYG